MCENSDGKNEQYTEEQDSTDLKTENEDPGLKQRLKNKFKTLGIAIGLGISGYSLTILWYTPFRKTALTNGSSTMMLTQYIVSALAAVTIGTIYLKYTDKGTDYIDINIPNKKSFYTMVGGVIALLLILYTISVFTSFFEVEAADHSIQQSMVTTTTDPRFILLMMPLSILVIGPSEEFVYRNLMQKRLYKDFRKWSAVILSSIVFAAIHYPTYANGDLPSVLVSLGTVFSLSLLLGFIYAWTENLVTVAFVHGTYNAALFGQLYLEMTRGIVII
jgi:hypothetical protein